MPFQIHALDGAPFRALFSLSEADLAKHAIQRSVADSKPGCFCRVSLADAEIGETVLLLNHEHIPDASPYRSRHAIFVREDAEPARLKRGEVPEGLAHRMLSLRAFDDQMNMVETALCQGSEAGKALADLLRPEAVARVHIHIAGPGCFAAEARR